MRSASRVGPRAHPAIYTRKQSRGVAPAKYRRSQISGSSLGGRRLNIGAGGARLYQTRHIPQTRRATQLPAFLSQAATDHQSGTTRNQIPNFQPQSHFLSQIHRVLQLKPCRKKKPPSWTLAARLQPLLCVPSRSWVSLPHHQQRGYIMQELSQGRSL